ncbi:MAG: hypothetical protein ABII71_01875 [Candidatus Micrarchaeota archaeon]
MRRIILLLMASSLLFTGSVTQIYHQVVGESGNSVIGDELDVSFIVQLMPDNFLSSIATTCAFDKELGCSVDEENKWVYMSREFSSGGSYYSFSAEYGIPYVDYSLTVNKLPKDQFSKEMERIMVASGMDVVEGTSVAPLDFRDADECRKMASSMELFGMEILYRVEMPGSIVSAQAGAAGAEVSGSTATFSLSEVLAEQAPLVVKSRQVNWLYIFVIGGAIVVAALAVTFLKPRKARTARVPPKAGARMAKPMPAPRLKTAPKRRKQAK